MFGPTSPPGCFASRRKRFLELHPGPAALGSGLARVRNFEANRYAFRAESHFLYFVGRHIESALLCFDRGKATLYAPETDPAEALWHEQRSLDDLSKELELEVKPLRSFEAPEDVATLAPDETESAMFLEEMLGRIVDAGSAADVEEQDLDLAVAIIELRSSNDAFAVTQMEAALAVTERAHRRGMQVTSKAKHEVVVRAAMEHAIAEAGLIPAYNPIVTTRGHILHAERSAFALESGALLLADVGAESAEGWASDVTRTWPRAGRFSPLQREVYEAVLTSQQAAIETLKPGVRFRDVHRRAAKALAEGLIAIGLLKGDAEELLERDIAALFFPHGIGHLLGLDVHDMEDLGDRAGYDPGRERSERPAERFLRLDRDLISGMVVTIEPGFYCIPTLLDDETAAKRLADAVDSKTLEAVRKEVSGIRIEDDVLITDDGYRVLSASIPKSVSDVEAAMQA